MDNKMRFGLHYESPIFYDLETSGLRFDQHEIIQIAALHPVTGDFFECKVQFDEKKASKEALEINHYCPSRWAWALTQEEAARQFNQFCENHVSIARKSAAGKPYRSAVLMGWNNCHFDKYFIDVLMEKFNLYSKADYRQYDAYELCKFLIPWQQEYNLTAMAKYFGIHVYNAHDAFSDVRTIMKVAACLIEILAESDTYKMPGWAKEVLADLNADDEIPF
jgi:DNA polymerase-3 subunit epsilon